MKEFDKAGIVGGGNNKTTKHNSVGTFVGKLHNNYETDNYNDSGTPAHFFYCAKASKSEREEGLVGMEKKVRSNARPDSPMDSKWADHDSITSHQNHHPTVKPLALMKYLVTMFSREGQIVIDPFAGSGTTLIACERLNRKYIGIDSNEDYVEIAKRRINLYGQGKLL
jgi:site-specific DNA-methyltransferase (adenine-specific)